MEAGQLTAWSLRGRSALAVLAVLAAWEFVGDIHLVPPLFLPPFSIVATELGRSLADGTLASDLALSLGRTFGGLGLAMISGVALGLLMARNRFIHWLLDPLIAVGFPSPKIAFIPIFVLWFGIESLSKILLVAFSCVFPVVIGSYGAARAVNRIFLWSAASLGSDRRSLFLFVIFPACCPRIFTTLRVALPVALVTTFTAEMVAGGGGMGATLIYSQRFFESPTVFAYILVMLAVGLVLDSAMLRTQNRYFAWAEE